MDGEDSIWNRDYRRLENIDNNHKSKRLSKIERTRSFIIGKKVKELHY